MFIFGNPRYDRYWAGRTVWSDVMRTSRTLGRFIWFHVPLHLVVPPVDPPSEDPSTLKKRAREVRKMMSEKRMALDLVLA